MAPSKILTDVKVNNISAHFKTPSDLRTTWLTDLGFWSLQFVTLSCLTSSFFTDFRLALRSIEPLCLEPRRALIISSADTLTFRRAGFLNLPPRSCTFSFSSWICLRQRVYICACGKLLCSMTVLFIRRSERLTSLLCLLTLCSQSYRSSSTISIFSWSCLQSFWKTKYIIIKCAYTFFLL